MPRKFLRRILPHHKTIKEHKHLKMLGDWLHDPGIWQLHRHSVARAVAIGLFIGFLPIPLQMLTAALVAILLRSNLVIAVIMVWIANPITIGPLYYFSYKVGMAILPLAPRDFSISFSVEWALNELAYIWQPLLFGSIICGAIAAFIGYWATHLIWRILVVRNWRGRKWAKKKL